MKSYRHTKQYYIDKYSEYKNLVEYRGGSNIFRNLNEFTAAYEALRVDKQTRIVDQLAYSSIYGTNYKTALAEYKMAKKVGINITLETAKTMTTTEFAKQYKSQIEHAYRSYRKQGKSAKEANALISQYWFGSK